MGTRSVTNIYDGEKLKKNLLVSIYQQMDGYYEGVGKELQRFLTGMTIVNGFGSNTPEKAANGMGCLAAQLISHLKQGIGGVYITSNGEKSEYNYHIFLKDGQLQLEGTGGDDKKVFSL